MAKDQVKSMIAQTFLDMADALESGRMGGRPKIALTGMGSEHGEENTMQGAVLAAKQGVDVYYIGTLHHEGHRIRDRRHDGMGEPTVATGKHGYVFRCGSPIFKLSFKNRFSS